MKRICAWCKTEMGSKPADAYFEHTVTHGICPACLETHFQLRQSTLIEILDRLNTPVIVMDSTMCVCSANKQARAILHKRLKDIEGVIAGDVLECAYAKSAEGCGNTSHCDGCTIRNTVIDTFKTGNSHLRIPAQLINGTPDNNQLCQLLLSTEKVDDLVLLRIDTN